MAERPIIFDAESVRAIIEGSKTQTRRAVNPQPELSENGYDSVFVWRGHEWHSPFGRSSHCSNPGVLAECPFGQPGDRLWVREVFCYQYESKIGCADVKFVRYRSNGEIKHCDEIQVAPHRLASWKHEGGGYYLTSWKSPIHMPRWASRITLEVTGVRVERLHQVGSDGRRAEHVLAEGITQWEIEREREWFHQDDSPAIAFSRRWDAINAKRGYPWESNPWVFVVEFRLLDGREHNGGEL